MPRDISEFVNATSHLRIYKQAEAAEEERLRAAMSKINEREREIIGMHFDCEADATKYVEDAVLADMDSLYKTEPYISFMTDQAKTRTRIQETELRLSKLDLKFDNIKLEVSP